jgi:hypothetical protein
MLKSNLGTVNALVIRMVEKKKKDVYLFIRKEQEISIVLTSTAHCSLYILFIHPSWSPIHVNAPYSVLPRDFFAYVRSLELFLISTYMLSLHSEIWHVVALSLSR